MTKNSDYLTKHALTYSITRTDTDPKKNIADLIIFFLFSLNFVIKFLFIFFFFHFAIDSCKNQCFGILLNLYFNQLNFC